MKNYISCYNVVFIMADRATATSTMAAMSLFVFSTLYFCCSIGFNTTRSGSSSQPQPNKRRYFFAPYYNVLVCVTHVCHSICCVCIILCYYLIWTWCFIEWNWIHYRRRDRLILLLFFSFPFLCVIRPIYCFAYYFNFFLLSHRCNK